MRAKIHEKLTPIVTEFQSDNEFNLPVFGGKLSIESFLESQIYNQWESIFTCIGKE
jgi:hypothetical protein